MVWTRSDFENAAEECRFLDSGGCFDRSLIDDLARNGGDAELRLDSGNGGRGGGFGTDGNLGSFDRFFGPFADKKDVLLRAGGREHAVHALIQRDRRDEQEHHDRRSAHRLDKTGGVAEEVAKSVAEGEHFRK